MSVCHADCLYVYSLSTYLSIVSLSTHSAVQMSVYLAYVYPSIKSVCPLVSQCIYPFCFSVFHPLVCLSLFYMSVSIHPKLFSTVPKYKTSSGDMFCGRVGGVLVHQCPGARMHQCANAQIQIHRVLFGKCLCFFSRQFNEPPVITFCILIFFYLPDNSL